MASGGGTNRLAASDGTEGPPLELRVLFEQYHGEAGH
jgi:hypothetical protein